MVLTFPLDLGRTELESSGWLTCYPLLDHRTGHLRGCRDQGGPWATDRLANSTSGFGAAMASSFVYGSCAPEFSTSGGTGTITAVPEQCCSTWSGAWLSWTHPLACVSPTLIAPGQ